MKMRSQLLGLMAMTTALAYSDPLQRNHMPERDVSPRKVEPIIPKGHKRFVLDNAGVTHESDKYEGVDEIAFCYALNIKNAKKKFTKMFK